MTVLLIEGVVATGKTTLLAELQQTTPWRERPTKLVLSEHYTERVLELTGPTVESRLALLGRHVDICETLHQIWRASRFGDSRTLAPLVLCERFHLTHAAQANDFAPFSGLEQRLENCGALLVFLYHPKELLLERIKATENRRNDMWRRWLRSLGTDQELASYFMALQEKSAKFFAASTLPKIAIEAHGKEPAVMAAELALLLNE
ncbi:MAG: hypothetical protein KGZ92_08040 [Firmicutes bacterium]|nr:hypothetical protein [Dethiobacter sp.]MBS3889217.1 hypothetical protein [Bacillota bacterium]MBS4053871.1 hypothetical protein [Thermaerobacter sp.]